MPAASASVPVSTKSMSTRPASCCALILPASSGAGALVKVNRRDELRMVGAVFLDRLLRQRQVAGDVDDVDRLRRRRQCRRLRPGRGGEGERHEERGGFVRRGHGVAPSHFIPINRTLAESRASVNPSPARELILPAFGGGQAALHASGSWTWPPKWAVCGMRTTGCEWVAILKTAPTFGICLPMKPYTAGGR